MPKGIRNPVSENQNITNKNVRKGMRTRMKLDASIYEERYAGKKLMWITDSSSDLDWWIQQGAECVPRASVNRKVIEGVNDKQSTGFVTVPSGNKKDGSVELSYLMVIDHDIYDELVTIPEADRREEVKRAMRLGQDQSGLAAHLPGGGGIQTYAPNLPDGKSQGFNEIRSRGPIQ